MLGHLVLDLIPVILACIGDQVLYLEHLCMLATGSEVRLQPLLLHRMCLGLWCVLICRCDYVLRIVGNGPLDIGYVAYRRVQPDPSLAIGCRAKREEVVNLLLMARLSGVQARPAPVLRDGSFACTPLLVIVCKWMAHSTVSRGRPLSAKSVADPDHLGLRRGFIKDRPSEVAIGVCAFSLTSYGPHLHLALLHARYYGLLVRAHALVGIGGDHVRIQVSARVVTAVSGGSPWFRVSSLLMVIMDVLGATPDDHLRLLKLIVESHFGAPVATLAMKIGPAGNGHCLVSGVERLDLHLAGGLSYGSGAQLEGLTARGEPPRGHHSRCRMVKLLDLLRNPGPAHEAILFIISVLLLELLCIALVLSQTGVGPTLVRRIAVGLHLV